MTRSSAPSFSRYLPVVAVVSVAAVLCFWNLGDTPMFVGGDEAYFALHARSIAATGRDIDGRLLPLFFRIDLATWYQPMLVYLMAAVLRVFSVSEWSIRAPIAFIGVVNVLLVYAVGRKIFASTRYALLAALMLAMTPAHLIITRMALDYMCPVPFALGWLWCLLTAIETENVWIALGGGLLLGIGVFSYVAAWFIMPVYLLITLATLWLAKSRPRLLLAACAGFLAPLLPFAVWGSLHPDVLGTIFARYSIVDAQHSSLLQSARHLLHYIVIQERLSLYWKYFDPVYLFLAGSPDPTLGTRKAGVFLAAVGVLLVYGVYDIVRRSDRGTVLLAGFATAPLAPVLINSGNAIQRQMVVLPFGVLIAVYGARRLLEYPNKTVRACAMLAILTLPIQFTYFAHDYFTDYRARAADRIDPLNLGSVAQDILGADRSTVPRVYLSEALDDGVARWRFYLAKYHREDLWPRTWILDPPARNHWSAFAPMPTMPLDGSQVPAGSFFVLNANDPGMNQLVGNQKCCALVRTVLGARGVASSLVIRKLP
jgi:4-amino-4-deoxy-L-arabinose transferase-like glycosyltransferase